MLLAFGLGWALIAVLTVRHTSRPQRWATVPAAAMGATGLALLAFTPGNAAMTAAQLGVAPGRAGARGLDVRPDAPVLDRPRPVAGDAGDRGRSPWRLSAPPTRTSSRPATRRAYPAPGQTYEVGGHRLHLDCHGQGGPTVVLFNGLGEISASWARITDPVGETTRVCAYDRAGQGWSERRRRAPRTA